jgi:DsbC/DsbD-like thiol-disulfide interchange protein
MSWGTPRRVNRTFRTVFAVLCALSAALSQSSRPQHAHLSLILDRTALVPTESDWIGLRFELDPGWHIYWTNPGDSGEPPKIVWHLPVGIQAGDLQFPAPQRIPDHSLIDYGYQGSVVLLSKLTVPAGATSKQAEIGADVKYLVCREVCIPAKDHLSVTVPIGGRAKAAPEASQIQAAETHLPRPLPRGVRASAASTQDGFVVTIAGKSPSMGQATDFISADEQVIENIAKPAIDIGKDEVVIRLKKSEQLNHPISQVRGLLIAGDRAYNIDVPVASGKAGVQNRKLQKKVKE